MISLEWLEKHLQQVECRIKSFVGFDASYCEDMSPVFRYRTDYTVLINDVDIQNEIIVTVYQEVDGQYRFTKGDKEKLALIKNLYIYNYIEDGILKTRGHVSAINIKKRLPSSS